MLKLEITLLKMGIVQWALFGGEMQILPTNNEYMANAFQKHTESDVGEGLNG